MQTTPKSTRTADATRAFARQLREAGYRIHSTRAHQPMTTPALICACGTGERHTLAEHVERLISEAETRTDSAPDPYNLRASEADPFVGL